MKWSKRKWLKKSKRFKKFTELKEVEDTGIDENTENNEVDEILIMKRLTRNEDDNEDELKMSRN